MGDGTNPYASSRHEMEKEEVREKGRPPEDHEEIGTVALAGSGLVQVPGRLGEQRVLVTYDGGSDVSLVERATFEQLPPSVVGPARRERKLQDIQKRQIKTYGAYELTVCIGHSKVTFPFIIVDRMPSSLLIGRDFCKANNVNIYHQEDVLEFGGEII